MSLEMGCFDFIVDRSGDHMFVEANQQGQFFRIEDDLPQMKALAGFCECAVGLSRSSAYPEPLTSMIRHKQLARQLAASGAIDTRKS